jgi:deoxycytidylate deaminase
VFRTCPDPGVGKMIFRVSRILITDMAGTEAQTGQPSSPGHTAYLQWARSQPGSFLMLLCSELCHCCQAHHEERAASCWVN